MVRRHIQNIIDLCNRVFPNETTGCWEWRGSSDKRGYGYIVLEKKIWRAHRLSFYLSTGRHLGKFHVCHKCDNPACVNPDHLFLGTDADNVIDCIAKGRREVKLTPTKVRKIRTSPLNNMQTARKLKVNYSTLRAVREGRTWKHVG